MRDRPIQIVHSFEGLVNGLDAVEVMPRFGRPRPYDLRDFEERLDTELDALARYGVGGIAVNVGYEGYLESEEGWRRFITGVEKAVERGLRIWIYDENGYPSGSAGGLVTRGHPELEAMGIKRMVLRGAAPLSSVDLPDPQARLLAAFSVDKDGRRARLPLTPEGMPKNSEGESSALEIYFTAPLFEGTHADYRETSRQGYMNVLDRRAVARFLALTHARYSEKLPGRLWEHVQAVFTDEPSLMSHVMHPQPGRTYYPSVPWSDESSGTFVNRHGYRIEDCIWSLFEGDAPEDHERRRDFWGIVAEMYEDAFAVQSAGACSERGVSLSGHLLAEETLWQHTAVQADAIGVLQHFHIPGLDMLSCSPELVNDAYVMTLKTAQSAAVLGDKPDLMVEVSEYSEYWTEERRRRLQSVREYWEGPRKGNPLEHIRYTLALLFLTGVREFAFYFPWRQFSETEYEELCGFVAQLNSLGRGAAYRPTCALYYPIETMWEEYVPSTKHIWAGALEEQSERCQALNQAMTDTCKALFFDNVQYVLAGRRHLPTLSELGIRTLLYPVGERPEPEAMRLCEEAGIGVVELASPGLEGLSAPCRAGLCDPAVQPGLDVVCAFYDGFVFVLNTGSGDSSFVVQRSADGVFPQRGEDRVNVSEPADLASYECAFIYAR